MFGFISRNALKHELLDKIDEPQHLKNRVEAL